MGVPVVVSDEDWADVGRFWEEVSATHFDHLRTTQPHHVFALNANI